MRICRDVGRQSLADTTHQRGVLPCGTGMPPYDGVVRMCQDVGRQPLADTTHQRGVLPGGMGMPPYGYIWKAKGKEILRKIQPAREALARLKSAVPSV